MDYEARKVGEISEGDVYLVDAPLYKQIGAFKQVGIQYPFLIHPSQTAEFRLKNPQFKECWTRTCILPVAVKGEKPILYDESPFVNEAMAFYAVKCHQHGKYPSLQREFYDSVLELAKIQETLEPEDRNAIVLSTTENFELVPEHDVAKFLLRKQATEYFDKHNHKAINFYNFPTKDIPKNEARGNYLWFYSPDNGSGFDASYRLLYTDGRAFGVLRKTAEGGSQNSGYSTTQVREAIPKGLSKAFSELRLGEGLVELVAKPTQKQVLEVLRTKQ